MKLLLFGNASAASLLHCAFELRLSHEQFQQFVDGFHDDTVLLNPSVQTSLQVPRCRGWTPRVYGGLAQTRRSVIHFPVPIGFLLL